MKVLAWPAFQHSGVNPYTDLLYGQLRRLDVETDDFSFRRALGRRYDIFHLHWPEHYITRKNPVKAAIGILAFFTTIFWQRALGAKLVWTVHNLRSHDQVRPRLERYFWLLFTRLIDGYLCLTDFGSVLARSTWPRLSRVPSFVVPHGHYLDVYPNTSDKATARRFLALDESSPVILHFGSIAPYKNVPSLIEAFGQSFGDRNVVLLIAGACENSKEGTRIRELASGDPRIKLFLRKICNQEIQHFFNASDLVVLPFTDILNSGSAILALSFSCPVLVPELGAMPELQKTVGREWVRTFPFPLTPDALGAALDWAERLRTSRPDLHELNWQSIALKTRSAFEAILSVRAAGPRHGQRKQNDAIDHHRSAPCT